MSLEESDVRGKRSQTDKVCHEVVEGENTQYARIWFQILYTTEQILQKCGFVWMSLPLQRRNWINVKHPNNELYVSTTIQVTCSALRGSRVHSSLYKQLRGFSRLRKKGLYSDKGPIAHHIWEPRQRTGCCFIHNLQLMCAHHLLAELERASRHGNNENVQQNKLYVMTRRVSLLAWEHVCYQDGVCVAVAA